MVSIALKVACYILWKAVRKDGFGDMPRKSLLHRAEHDSIKSAKDKKQKAHKSHVQAKDRPAQNSDDFLMAPAWACQETSQLTTW